jgi:two-component system response regulator PilR (NtrC family)
MGTGQSVSILLAEDHDDTRAVLSRLLVNHGYTVHAARSIADAKVLAAGNRCDLLISDLGLSDGSGETLMQELKTQYGLKGLAMSGYTMPENIEAARKAGFDQFIAKPLSFSNLLQVIEELTR